MHDTTQEQACGAVVLLRRTLSELMAGSARAEDILELMRGETARLFPGLHDEDLERIVSYVLEHAEPRRQPGEIGAAARASTLGEQEDNVVTFRLPRLASQG